jgi:SAM-dependent methyltransferase
MTPSDATPSASPAELGRSFGSAVDAYDRGRPGYPDDAVDWLVGHAPARVARAFVPERARAAGADASDRVRAVDLGAGTGKFTASLVARGLDVTAVEPDTAMLERLTAQLPSVRALAGTAEAIPLPDASVELVTAAQSWHWVDPECASAEVARVLVPGGVLALVWNIRDESVPWVRRLGEVAGSSAAERFETVQPPLGDARGGARGGPRRRRRGRRRAARRPRRHALRDPRHHSPPRLLAPHVGRVAAPAAYRDPPLWTTWISIRPSGATRSAWNGRLVRRIMLVEQPRQRRIETHRTPNTWISIRPSGAARSAWNGRLVRRIMLVE